MTSIIWHFFKEKEGDPRIAICQLCNATITREKVGAERKTWNTTNMLNHVRGEHKDSYEAQKPDHEKKQKEREIENPTPGGQKSRFQQAIIKSLYAGKKKWTVDDSRAKPINQKLIQLVVMDNQPFTIAEDDGFIAYSAALNPLYTVPGRTMLSEMLNQEYQRVRDIIQSEVDTAASINFTSDLWTEDTTRASFISLSGKET